MPLFSQQFSFIRKLRITKYRNNSIKLTTGLFFDFMEKINSWTLKDTMTSRFSINSNNKMHFTIQSKIAVLILFFLFSFIIVNYALAQEGMPLPPSEEPGMPSIEVINNDDTPQTTISNSQSAITDWQIETGIPISGLTKGTPIKDPGVYFNKIYTFAVSAVMVVAIITVIYAGLLWMTSPYIVQKKEAMDRMTGVALGVLLLLSTNLILKTINPNLVNWDLSKLTSVGGLNDSITGMGSEGTAGGDNGNGGNENGGTTPATPVNATENGKKVLDQAKSYNGKIFGGSGGNCYTAAKEIYNAAGMNAVAYGDYGTGKPFTPSPGDMMDINGSYGAQKAVHTVIFDHAETQMYEGKSIEVWYYQSATPQNNIPWQYTSQPFQAGSNSPLVPYSPTIDGYPIHMWHPVPK